MPVDSSLARICVVLLAASACPGQTPTTTAPAEPAPAPARVPDVDPEPAPEPAPTTFADPTRVDVEVHRIGTLEPQVFRTGDLATLRPTYRFAIVVHTPSKDDRRYQSHGFHIDGLFHPHDQAPDVAYVYSSVDGPLENADGRHRHQVDPEGARAIQAAFGEFVILLLDRKGAVIRSWTEPASRSDFHQGMGYRDRTPTPRPPPPGPPNKRR